MRGHSLDMTQSTYLLQQASQMRELARGTPDTEMALLLLRLAAAYEEAASIHRQRLGAKPIRCDESGGPGDPLSPWWPKPLAARRAI